MHSDSDTLRRIAVGFEVSSAITRKPDDASFAITPVARSPAPLTTTTELSFVLIATPSISFCDPVAVNKARHKHRKSLPSSVRGSAASNSKSESSASCGTRSALFRSTKHLHPLSAPLKYLGVIRTTGRRVCVLFRFLPESHHDPCRATSG